jgi:hypothetical protein
MSSSKEEILNVLKELKGIDREIIEKLDGALDEIQSHADDLVIFGECRKCEINEDGYDYWDCPKSEG